MSQVSCSAPKQRPSLQSSHERILYLRSFYSPPVVEAGGKAKFNKLRLDTGEPEGEYQNALLFAGDCKAKQIEGFPNRCGPEAMLQGLQQD